MAWEDRAYNSEREGRSSGPRFVFPMPSKLTFGLILSCVVIFFIQRLTGNFGAQIENYGALKFTGLLAFKQPWRWITYQYLHGGGAHLFWNVLSIYFFVPPLEKLWGWKRTLGFYTAGGIVAGITFGIMNLFVPVHSLIGASGSIFAVLGALTAIMPGMQVLAMMIIPITMRTLAMLYTIFFIFTVFGDRDPSDAAHLGGLAFGFFIVRFGMGLLQRLGWPSNEFGLFSSGGAVAGGDYGYEPVKTRRPSRWAAKRAAKLIQADRQEQRRIDQILAKVSANGMHSLTWRERRALKKATEHQRQRDKEIGRVRRL